MQRQQFFTILKDLNQKMVFLVGPRQVGKTWLAKEMAKNFSNAVYLNYDSAKDREIIVNESWPEDTGILILDELHNMKKWKNYLKGVYDTKLTNLKILVTGSARLDTFRQAGDPLLGRYFLHHLMPFSLAELKQINSKAEINKLILRSGFPEPFLSKSEELAKKWRNQYFEGLIRNDILEFKRVHDFRALKLILELLRNKAGSPISYLSISEDAQVSPITVKRYIEIFESLYIIFLVTPYTKNIARAILKEPKVYFYDTGLVEGDLGKKFENFVAVSLLKSNFAHKDILGKNMELKYIRTKENKEVDFALVEEGKLLELIEVKLKDDNLNNNLVYLANKYNIPATQIVKELKHEQVKGKIKIVRAEKYLSNLFL